MSFPRRPPLPPTDDLVTLPASSDDAIATILRDRWASDKPYTRLSADFTVAVNPCKAAIAPHDDASKIYAANARDTSADKSILAPHVFEVARNAYFSMLRNKEDQAVILMYVSPSDRWWRYVAWPGPPVVLAALSFIYFPKLLYHRLTYLISGKLGESPALESPSLALLLPGSSST